MSNKLLPIIPLQAADMGPMFADKQYQYAGHTDAFAFRETPRKRLFEETILKLLYSNFVIDGIEIYESRLINKLAITEGQYCAVRKYGSIFYGRSGGTADNVQQGSTNVNPYVDFYGMPTSITCTGYNGEVIEANSPKDFVLGFDNCAVNRRAILTRPLITYVKQLAFELDDAFQAWKVAAETRKLGMIFECNNAQSKKVLQQALSKITENDPFIITTNQIKETTSVFYNTTNMSGLSEFHSYFMNVWGSVLDLIGIDNNSQNKRERLNVPELEMNRSLSKYVAAGRLRALNEFCDEHNEKFGTSIKARNYLAEVLSENDNSNEEIIPGEVDENNVE